MEGQRPLTIVKAVRPLTSIDWPKIDEQRGAGNSTRWSGAIPDDMSPFGETERKRLVKTLCGVTCPAFGSGHLRTRVDEAASAKNSNESNYRKRSAMATTTLVFRTKHMWHQQRRSCLRTALFLGCFIRDRTA